MGAALCSNQNKIVQDTVKQKLTTKQVKQFAEDDIDDQDQNGFKKSDIARQHEKLWQAVESSDYAAAEKYLDWNDICEANLYDPFGQTMLHKAASLGDTKMLMLLIERTGSKPDLVNAALATPLHLACRNGRAEVVKFLIGCGVEVNQQDEHGQTALLVCCIHGHHELVSILVEASIVGHLPEQLEVDLPNHQGLTPLNCAAIKGDLQTVQCLVSRGQCDINQTSPKGCTPLIYAGRGGYPKVVEYLVKKRASPLRQDNAGGTVLHHAVEKGHISVLESLLENGVDMYSAVEIADNAGRTPLFEAVDNIVNDEEKAIQMIDFLTRSRNQGGLQASPNVVNYNGQTPLFAAARQGSLDTVALLIQAGAKPDLTSGELVKDNEADLEENEDDRNFMEAFRNCMTPCQVATVLGYDDIVQYLCQECNANINLQTNTLKYTSLHLAVLAQKPEMIMHLLTKLQANPMLEDSQQRAFLDMIYVYMPAYVDTFQSILEKIESRTNRHLQVPLAAEDDQRQIKGKKTEQEIESMYHEQTEQQNDLAKTVNLHEVIKTNLIDAAAEIDQRIEQVYGAKTALCIVSQNWQHKEQALQLIYRVTERYFCGQSCDGYDKCTVREMVQAALTAVALTCRDKVIKVFNMSLSLFVLVTQSQKVESDKQAMSLMLQQITQDGIIQKLLIYSESSNTRQTNKIHEALLDICYMPQIGEDLVSKIVLEQIQRHNNAQSNHKGLLAQLALTYKLASSFSVEIGAENFDGDPRALNKEAIVDCVMVSCAHGKEDIRNAAIKILVEVQRQTGAITETDVEVLPEKIRETVMEKVSNTLLNPKVQKVKETTGENDEIAPTLPSVKLTQQALQNFKKIVQEKGSHKDWTQRELAIGAVQECFNLNLGNILDSEEDFLTQCVVLLQTSLDCTNIQIYLTACEVLQLVVRKVQTSEALLDGLPSLIQTVVLRTTDTNTRLRKRSVDLINQLWEITLNRKANLTASQMVANCLCDAQLSEKAIVGRLGLFIKRAMLIESAEDLSKKSVSQILGKDYEQIAVFACQWCLHKNKKVRQSALKLAVELCRINSLDQRGQPFKQRIVSYIMGLRTSIRDPLVKKINEVCGLQFIDEKELELSAATKARAASYDVRRAVNRPGSSGLPAIGQASLPSVPKIGLERTQPTIVLPHSEPLAESQKMELSQQIELFGLQLVTCFSSQTWSSRFAAIQKVGEQLHNLDPRRRDAFAGEINRGNLPPELTFPVLLRFFEDGLRDPNLKNYISVLDLIQTALPLYFRYLRPEQIKKELQPLITTIITKTSDLKKKVREASMNFCLHMSHQVEIGCETVVELMLCEMDKVLQTGQDKNQSAAAPVGNQNTFGNSYMIVCCLNLLAQFQSQTGLVTKESPYYHSYSNNINRGLKHSNPQVRKEAEALFKVMFTTFGDAYTKELREQKAQLVTKLVSEAKAENTSSQVNEYSLTPQLEQAVRDDYLTMPCILQLLKGNEEKLIQLKQPNPKKRLIAIVEIKKVIQQRVTQINAQTARDLVEPLSILLRHLLRDDSVEVHLESLQLLKFIVGSLAPHLSSFDLHLMIGQFIMVIVQGQNQNMKSRIASDKVIVYLANHVNIGSNMVASEVLKSIERYNRLHRSDENEHAANLLRFYGILQMLIQQFCIVLCYQPSFYTKLLETIADTLQKASDEPALKSICTQLVMGLYQIDAKLIDEGVGKLDFTKKTHLRKIVIELENTSQKGFVNQNLVSGVARPKSPDASMRDTQQSFTSLQSRGQIMSPRTEGISMNRRLQRDRNSEVRSSRPQVQATPDQGIRRAGTLREQEQAGVGWLERRQTDMQSLLPSITDSSSCGQQPPQRRRQIGQGFVGASSKAAGFNRNDFGVTAEISLKARELPSATGIAISGQKSLDEWKAPLYVPTQRTILKRPEGYQPSLLSKVVVDKPLLHTQEVKMPPAATLLSKRQSQD